MSAPGKLLSCSEQQVSDEFLRTSTATTDDQIRSSSGAPVLRELLLARKSTGGWKGFVSFAGRDDRLRKTRLQLVLSGVSLGENRLADDLGAFSASSSSLSSSLESTTSDSSSGEDESEQDGCPRTSYSRSMSSLTQAGTSKERAGRSRDVVDIAAAAATSAGGDNCGAQGVHDTLTQAQAAARPRPAPSAASHRHREAGRGRGRGRETGRGTKMS